MAYIIQCRVCKKAVSSEALSCPHCGDPFVTEKRKQEAENTRKAEEYSKKRLEINDYIKFCTANHTCAVCGKHFEYKTSYGNDGMYGYYVKECHCDVSVLFNELDEKTPKEQSFDW